MTEWADRNTIQCEVVKIAMAQDRNGHILKLAIHPNDLPKDLILDPLGSRYVMVLARLNDQDEVVSQRKKQMAIRQWILLVFCAAMIVSFLGFLIMVTVVAAINLALLPPSEMSVVYSPALNSKQTKMPVEDFLN